jgi:hypothetical protein
MVLDDLRMHAAGVKCFGVIGRGIGAIRSGTSGEKHASSGRDHKEQNRNEFNFGNHNQFDSSEKMELFDAPAIVDRDDFFTVSSSLVQTFDAGASKGCRTFNGALHVIWRHPAAGADAALNWSDSRFIVIFELFVPPAAMARWRAARRR